MLKKYLCILLLLVVCYCQVLGQDHTVNINNQLKAGVLVEYIQPYKAYWEGRYHLVTIGGIISIPIYKSKNFFNVSIDLFPHYGFGRLVDSYDHFDYDYAEFYEFGLNVRLSLNFALSSNDVISGKIGSGPHYTTVEIPRQANGFIFSDYFLLCYTRAFRISGKKFAAEIELGYRHISNAGFQEPNYGVSTYLGGIGLYMIF